MATNQTSEPGQASGDTRPLEPGAHPSAIGSWPVPPAQAQPADSADGAGTQQYGSQQYGGQQYYPPAQPQAAGTGASWRLPSGGGRGAILASALAGVLLVAGIGFGAGYAVGHDRGAAGSTATQTGGPFGQGGGQGGFGPQGGTGTVPGQGGTGTVPGQGGTGTTSGQNTGVAVGQISAVDGASFTLTTSAGDLPVTTSGATQVSDALGGAVSDLQVGQVVVVQGTTTDGASLTATAIADPSALRSGSTGSGTTSTGPTGDDDEETV